ncbi:hypothetical protein P4V72_05915 [Bacillus thuringiensis]|uniref:Uncharacterized protein n=2 Tax=root TaxID=1 RepID=A0A4P8MXK6_9CAUD|nr:hypothetical protein [Bacillus thuringiensis]YP_009845465.1 hypothetical protein HWC18_gp29 [Bacillus phage vB_BtS_B83]MEB9095206.1 hypothetical protein [Bacillus cereus]AQY42374.1 hypothetical protein B4918_31215 [Bacillus thuringiensis]MDR4148549.1 hypothetical protein [Bacillus thuringiensis]MEC3575125.1 hypothetical protein [Bacillus thuringiensis]MED2021953.1 hypothetical protein [Bacillus thuringiensis]
MINHKELMQEAWYMAKSGAVRFGGKAKEYLSASLKIVWEQVRKVMKLNSELAAMEQMLDSLQSTKREYAAYVHNVLLPFAKDGQPITKKLMSTIYSVIGFKNSIDSGTKSIIRYTKRYSLQSYYLFADIKLLRNTKKATKYVVEVKNTAVAVHWIPKSILGENKELPSWFIKEKKLFLV